MKISMLSQTKFARALLIAALLVLQLSWQAARLVAQQPQAATNNAATGKTLNELFAAEWEYRLRQNPAEASSLGDRRYNDRWEDASLDAIKKRYEHNLDVLARLKAINAKALSPPDQLNYALFKKQFETEIAGYKFRWYLVPLNQREGIQTADQLADLLRFDTVKDYEDWIARLRSLPLYLDQTTALMREGIRAKILLPKVIMQRVPAQIDKQITEDAASSPFYKPFKRFPKSIPAAEQQRLAREAQTAIASGVVPAFQRFKQFFVGEYLPSSFDQVGIWQAPNGDAMYAFFARRFTTTDLTPREIHEIGLAEVKRIGAQMQEVMTKVGFTGTRQEFFKYLRTDPRFYFKTPEELYEAYQATAKTIDPRLVKVFKTLPRTPYGVEPIPANIAPDTTTAYYQQPAADGSRAGTYYVNLYKPEARPKWEMMALSLHESVPGHHLQIARGMELGDIPNFRRYGTDAYTAFVEGWGLYAESLGEDMNLYEDPYAKFGQLTYEMWRAVRLVVDTGIHSLHWDRQRAINFFLENAAKQELDVTNEVDRYIAWPGQALAYKIGELKIKQLRARSTSELGARFDLREFHDVVLGSGAVPLDILERNVNSWIAAKKQSK
ncbi:MAG: DUF885 family protein [Pyrinomonadaceae bacterium]